MQELRKEFDDPSLVAELEPEELGARLLFVLRRRLERDSSQRQFHLHNERAVLWPHYTADEPWAKTSVPVRVAVELAFAEAWAWLRAQGLLIPSPESSGDWEVLSRRARAFETADDFRSFATARLLPREILHLLLAQRVWLAFMRGDFDSAVFFAMKTVEVRVREASGLGNDLVGVALMRKAFDPEVGPLCDRATEKGEREARSALFAGAIGSYKNPQSHREVNLEDPARAMELVLLANHLLHIVDGRVTQRQAEAHQTSP